MIFQKHQQLISGIFTYCLIAIILSSCRLHKCRTTAKILHPEKSNFEDNLYSHQDLIKRINSKSFIQEFIRKTYLNNRHKLSFNAEDFQNNIRVKLVPKTDIIEISYFHSEKIVSEEIINKFVDWIHRDYARDWHKKYEKDNPSAMRKASLISKKMKRIENIISEDSEIDKQKLENEWQKYAEELKILYGSKKYLRELHLSVLPTYNYIMPPLHTIQLADEVCYY